MKGGAEERSEIKCPSCGVLEGRVIDSRGVPQGDRIRRRRKCLKCDARFTTCEMIVGSGDGRVKIDDFLVRLEALDKTLQDVRRALMFKAGLE